MELRLKSDDDVITVDLSPPTGGRRRCRIGDQEYEVELLHATHDTVVVRIDGHVVRALVARDHATLVVGLGGTVYAFAPAPSGEEPARRTRRGGSGLVTAPMPGKIIEMLVGIDDRVETGQPLVLLEAMKMEHTLTAEVDGIVSAIHVEAGSSVEAAELLLEVTPQPAAATP